MMILQKIGNGYVNPDEISHIVKGERYIHNTGKIEICYAVYMKNKESFVVSEEEMKKYIHGYFRYTMEDGKDVF